MNEKQNVTDSKVQENAAVRQPARGAYSSPTLVVYGTIGALTASGAATGKEGTGVGNGARRP